MKNLLREGFLQHHSHDYSHINPRRQRKKKKEKRKKKKLNNLHKTSCAVIRFLGSLTSIFLTKSFALSETLGQGSDEKSRSPRKTSSNISCSVSISKWKQEKEEKKRRFNLLER